MSGTTANYADTREFVSPRRVDGNVVFQWIQQAPKTGKARQVYCDTLKEIAHGTPQGLALYREMVERSDIYQLKKIVSRDSIDKCVVCAWTVMLARRVTDSDGHTLDNLNPFQDDPVTYGRIMQEMPTGSAKALSYYRCMVGQLQEFEFDK